MPKTSSVSKYSLFIFWFSLTFIWGVVKLFRFPEAVTELLLKPGIWVGIVFLFWRWKQLPRNVFSILKTDYLQHKPIWKVFVLPTLVTIVYFALSNYQIIQIPTFSVYLLLTTLFINFSTATVEEFVYRGVLFVQLKRVFSLIPAFLITQVLFVLSHLPTLILNSKSLQDGLIHLLFILIMSCLYTTFFNYSKSLYSSILSHGAWNFLVHYLVLS